MITMTCGFATGAGGLADGAGAVRGALGRDVVAGAVSRALEIVVGGEGFEAIDETGPTGVEEVDDPGAGVDSWDGNRPSTSSFWPVDVARYSDASNATSVTRESLTAVRPTRL